MGRPGEPYTHGPRKYQFKWYSVCVFTDAFGEMFGCLLWWESCNWCLWREREFFNALLRVFLMFSLDTVWVSPPVATVVTAGEPAFILRRLSGVEWGSLAGADFVLKQTTNTSPYLPLLLENSSFIIIYCIYTVYWSYPPQVKWIIPNIIKRLRASRSRWMPSFIHSEHTSIRQTKLKASKPKLQSENVLYKSYFMKFIFLHAGR